MTRKLLSLAAAAAVLGMTLQADAGLFGLFSHHDDCCAPACCEPEPCCAPEPACCAPAPTCCGSAPVDAAPVPAPAEEHAPAPPEEAPAPEA